MPSPGASGREQLCKSFVHQLVFFCETLLQEQFVLTRNFEHCIWVSAPNDMSILICRLPVFNLRQLEEALLTPTHGKLCLQWQRVEEMNSISTCMFIFCCFKSKLTLAIFLSPCACLHTRGPRHKLLFELITHSTVIVNNLCRSLCVAIFQSAVHDVLLRCLFSASGYWFACVATSYRNRRWDSVFGKFTGPLQHGRLSTWRWELPLPPSRSNSHGNSVNCRRDSLW